MLAAANAYLPEFIADYNQRFAVAPRSAESAHRPLAKGEDVERVLTLCERRTLSKNLTLSYNNVIYQIKTKVTSLLCAFGDISTLGLHITKLPIDTISK
jgi:hypothetical protein